MAKVGVQMSNFWNRHWHKKYLAKCRVLNGVKA